MSFETKLKSKFSLTVYAPNFEVAEDLAINLVAEYLNTTAEEALDKVEFELLVQTRASDDEASTEKFKVSVYASIKRNAVNFAK